MGILERQAIGWINLEELSRLEESLGVRLACLDVGARDKRSEGVEDTCLLELRLRLCSCGRGCDRHGNRGMAENIEEVRGTGTQRDIGRAQLIKMCGAVEMVAIKIERPAEVGRQLGV